MRKLMLILLIFVIAGCASARKEERIKYLNTIQYEPFQFYASKDDEERVWTRAINWLVNYSSTSVQKVENDTIQTFMPPENSSNIGYLIIRKETKGGGYYYSLNCYGSRNSNAKAVHNCRSLVHFMRWGIQPPPGAIKP